MTDESQEPTESVEESTAPSLEELSQEFSVEEQVSNFQAQPETQQQQQNWAPDPVMNPDAWIEYSRQQENNLSSLSQTVQSLNQKIQSYESQLAQQKVDADVDNAVSKVNEKLGVNPKMAEIALRMEYEQNPSFRKIWDNREQNPKAFNKALDVVADQYSSVFSVKQDHQLTENQIAAKKSLQTMNKAPSEPSSEWEDLSQAEFDARWAAMKRG